MIFKFRDCFVFFLLHANFEWIRKRKRYYRNSTKQITWYRNKIKYSDDLGGSVWQWHGVFPYVSICYNTLNRRTCVLLDHHYFTLHFHRTLASAFTCSLTNEQTMGFYGLYHRNHSVKGCVKNDSGSTNIYYLRNYSFRFVNFIGKSLEHGITYCTLMCIYNLSNYIFLYLSTIVL